MRYVYESSGKIKFYGCPTILIKRLYPSKFSVGEILYILRKARLGILEKIAVKKVYLKFIENETVFIYKDTFNSLHNEKDLCRQLEAYQESDSFKEYLQNLIISKGGCGAHEYLINGLPEKSMSILNDSSSMKIQRSLNNILRSKNALKNLKNLIQRLYSNNFKTKYYDIDLEASDIIKEIDSILLDGGTP